MQNDLTRPIIGIENRTAQEVFDIMCDRFRHLSATVPAGDGELVAWLHKRESELIAYAASFRGQEGSETIMSETMGRAKSLRYAADEISRSPLAASRLSQGTGAFQDRVAEAHHALFHDDPTDLAERRDRFYEEATETIQALGMTEDEAHALVAYTFSRPPGDVPKEIGASALTLASLCVIGGWDMMACAESDLAALTTPEKIAKVRAKRATRHGRGPLPGIDPALSGDTL